MCRKVKIGSGYLNQVAIFSMGMLTYFPMKEVRPEMRAISPEHVRQPDCKESVAGPSCGEQGHLHRTLHEERAPGLQDLPVQCHRVDTVQTVELKICLYTRQLVLHNRNPHAC